MNEVASTCMGVGLSTQVQPTLILLATGLEILVTWPVKIS